MRRLALALAPLLGLTFAAQALDPAKTPPITARQVDTNTLTLHGAGSTGDVSGMSLTAQYGNLARRLDQKLGDLPLSIEDFRGGPCANAADDTCAIVTAKNAACAIGSAEVRLSKPLYHVSDTTSLPAGCNSVWLHGISAQGTEIRSTALDRPIVQVSGIGNRVGGFLLKYDGTPTTGATALNFVNAAGPLADNFQTYNTDVGVKVSGGSGLLLHDFSLANHATAGFWADRTVDIFGTTFLINAGSLSAATAGNIRMTNKVEALNFVNGDVLLGRFSLITNADQNLKDQRPAYNGFTNVHFDSSRQGSILNNSVLFTFNKGWFSAGKDNGDGAGSFPGVQLLTVDSMKFVGGTEFFNCGSDGAVVSVNAKRTVFNAVSAESNGQTTASGASYGLRFQAGVTDFTVMASTGSNVLYGGKQNAMVIVEGGPSDRYTIMGNLVSGNINPQGVLDFGSGTNKLVQANW